MKYLSRTNQFKKDVKRMLKRGKDFTEFKAVIQQLVNYSISNELDLTLMRNM